MKRLALCLIAAFTFSLAASSLALAECGGPGHTKSVQAPSGDNPGGMSKPAAPGKG